MFAQNGACDPRRGMTPRFRLIICNTQSYAPHNRHRTIHVITWDVRAIRGGRTGLHAAGEHPIASAWRRRPSPGAVSAPRRRADKWRRPPSPGAVGAERRFLEKRIGDFFCEQKRLLVYFHGPVGAERGARRGAADRRCALRNARRRQQAGATQRAVRAHCLRALRAQAICGSGGARTVHDERCLIQTQAIR